ncbi:hypothetical protein C8Q75DRAFT_791510 [Abortiporus biennis]|nr:hypothetical protein C8Q75DRAFT_791510 [Abortiporus biennis]
MPSLLSRATQQQNASISTPPQPIPTIRFVSATPSEPSTSFSNIAPFASSPLAPRPNDSIAPRKKLVPKKSKLGLLSSSIKTSSSKENKKDFSDVVRRVGAPGTSSTRAGFEIYVDHNAGDPDMGDIVVVKKKKSRLGLDGMRWGALGEVTNVPSVPKETSSKDKAPVENLLKVKGDDSQKWWSIGRGRKDSKGKDKEQQPPRSRTPDPSRPLESRARFNSLDSGVMLFSKKPAQSNPAPAEVTNLAPPQPAPGPTATTGLLAPPSTNNNNSGSGSIALRAMKSMRSIARMKSWAQLNNDKEGNNSSNDAQTNITTATTKKEKKEKKKKEKTLIRNSGSSFEAGTLSPTENLRMLRDEEMKKTTKKKQSILGLGLPSTIRLGGNATVRYPSNASSASSIPAPAARTVTPNTQARLSADSAHLILNAAGRPSSVLSSGSSLRPPSTMSGVSAFSGRSARSSSSSVVSVKWDEEGLQHVREMQRKERKSRRESRESERKDEGTSSSGRKSRRASGEGRRRTTIGEIFPEILERESERPQSVGSSIVDGPLVRVEEATLDGHSDPELEEEIKKEAESSMTPVKRPRPRPVSEQMLGKSRPTAMTDGEDGVLSILDAATNDLASLINRLDLEATPASSNGSPLRQSPSFFHGSPTRAILPSDDSPLRRRPGGSPRLPDLRSSLSSISSLRPYMLAQEKTKPEPPVQQRPCIPPSRRQGMIGQNIAPWSALDWKVSPRKPTVRPLNSNRPTHKRTLTPSAEFDPTPVFQPLRPARTKVTSIVTTSPSVTTPQGGSQDSITPSSQTFGNGNKPSKIGLSFDEAIEEEPAPSPTPVFKRSSGHIRSGSILSALGGKRESVFSVQSNNDTVPLSPEARRGLGMHGTMGDEAATVDPEDPDSDIPNELQVILSGQSDEESIRSLDDNLSQIDSVPSSPTHSSDEPLPHSLAVELEVAGTDSDFPGLPIFRAQLIDEEANHADIDSPDEDENENDTKKSFDFTGELQKLNESGASDRRSFVEQLENAFRTPARIELGLNDGFLKVDVNAPPLPTSLPLPPLSAPLSGFKHTPPEDLVPRSVSYPELSSFNIRLQSSDDITTVVDTDDVEVSYRDSQTEDTLDNLIAQCEDDVCRSYPVRRSNSSMRSKASDGQLNTSFKFGGKASVPASIEEEEKEDSWVPPLTLSDIIPPLSHTRQHSRSSSLIDEDSSVLKSIMAKAAEMPIEIAPQVEEQARSRTNSQTSSKRRSMIVDTSRSNHTRSSSEISFAGFESFEQVRRHFEFGPDRPAFYPPPGANTSRSHNKHESIFSIASVSSYGAVLDAGVPDPFGFGPSRPPSEDLSISMSMNIDDTFSFIKKDMRSRQRVDSDASSFYFRAGRGHRRHESNLSVVSNAPPVSLYNRSFGGHRRNDSSASASSVALSYALHGPSGGRAIWARHRQEMSVDSVSSDFSAMRLGRPGLGDKMFDQMDHGMPLSAISASPPESVSGEQLYNRTSFDSIMDVERRTTTVEDSLFEKTGYRSSISSEGSVFGYDESHSHIGENGEFLRGNNFRPLSMMSVASIHTAAREDDTMITMIGGGHVRRRSVDSGVEGSPCIRIGVERKKHLRGLGRVLRFDQNPEDAAPAVPEPSPNKSKLVEKPSIASTSSYQFGNERMIMARKGLLERQSLEDSALIAHGEDILESFHSQPIFSRPGPASRSRSSTVTCSSGGETPPLSASDGSSISDGSQSSIDMGRLSALLASYSNPSNVGVARARSARARPRGSGHRRRISQARASRSSVYETIQEESPVVNRSPSPAQSASSHSLTAISTQAIHDTVYIVDSDAASSFSVDWDDEHGIGNMRRYYALRNEAHETVVESKRVWMDTPFSIFALQSFEPPRNRYGMQAMLEHSQKNYGPLPSELRPHRVRSRTSSRASPYPARTIKATMSPERSRSIPREDSLSQLLNVSKPFASPPVIALLPSPGPLHQVNVNTNLSSHPPTLDVKPFTPFAVELDKSSFNEAPPLPPLLKSNGLPARPRVTSSARRSAFGWSKRSTGKSSSSEQKENTSVGMNTPGESLRISRPRPRGRPTPSARASTIRV